MAQAAIEARGLRKTYDSTRGVFRREKVTRAALEGVDLAIEPDELFGLLLPSSGLRRARRPGPPASRPAADPGG